MTVNGAALAGRLAAEQLMTDACVIVRATGRATLNQVTGLTVGPTSTTVYAGKCRFKPVSRMDEQTDAGETAVYKWRWTISVPYGVGIELNDVITPTASQDPVLLTPTPKQMRVRAIERGTHITAHRLHCEEIADGSG
jgi:hypothetical protein